MKWPGTCRLSVLVQGRRHQTPSVGGDSGEAEISSHHMSCSINHSERVAKSIPIDLVSTRGTKCPSGYFRSFWVAKLSGMFRTEKGESLECKGNTKPTSQQRRFGKAGSQSLPRAGGLIEAPKCPGSHGVAWRELKRTMVYGWMRRPVCLLFVTCVQ